jgi:hypothetical protein
MKQTSLLAYFSTRKVKNAVYSFETSVNVYRTTRCHTPEDSIHIHRCENLNPTELVNLLCLTTGYLLIPLKRIGNYIYGTRLSDFSTSLIKLIASFLTDRKFQVLVEDEFSAPRK